MSISFEIQRDCLMARDVPDNISFPWDEGQGVTTKLQCPKCGNDGMDGTITANAHQFGLERICIKPDPETGKPCNHRWSGGIGVQRADFSEPPGIPGVASGYDDRPHTQFTGAPHRDPRKNVSYGEDD